MPQPYRIVSVFMLGLLLSLLPACNPATTPTTAAPEDPTMDPAAIGNIIPGAMLTIGDVETSLVFVVRPSNLLISDPTIDVEEVENFMNRLTKTTVNFPSNLPEALPFVFAMTSTTNYEKDVVQINGKVVVEGEVIGEFSGLFGVNAMDSPIGGNFDLRRFLDPLPDTALIMAEAELVFFQDTDAESITVETPAPDDAERVTVYSNPVRVNFKQE